MRHYGQALGRAFQIADDLLDVEASPESLGKATAKDAERGKATFVSLLGPQGARDLLAAAVNECRVHLDRLPGETSSILSAAAWFAAERTR